MINLHSFTMVELETLKNILRRNTEGVNEGRYFEDEEERIITNRIYAGIESVLGSGKKRTYRDMNRGELMAAARKWASERHCGCVVYQTHDGDAGLQWSEQQILPSNVSWTHVER